MRYINKFLLLCLLTTIVILGCRKVESLPFYEDGNAVSLTASKATITPVAADSLAQVISFSWTSPNYSTDSAKYKYIIEIDSSGRNFAKKVTKEVIGSRTVSLTGKELNNILLNYGFSLSTPYKMDVRVVSSYNNNNERYNSNIVNFVVSPYKDSSVLSVSPTNVTLSLNNASVNAANFAWTPSFNGYSGTVTYALQYDSAGKNFTSPKEIAVGASLFTKAMNNGELNQTALDEGVAGGSTAKIEYRVKASTALGAVVYSNVVAVTMQTYVPFYNFYIVGSINGWDINNAWEIISDRAPSRWGKVFYTYLKMNAGDEFKFAKEKGNWGSAYGNNGASGAGFSTGYNQGGNFQIATSGIYRLTIDIENNMAYIQQKQVGAVGGMQGWNASSPNFGGYLERDKFMIITNSNNDEFKFHDGTEWNNSTPDKARWWGKGSADGLLDIDGNGANIVATGSPRSRLIWDGTNPQSLKYEIYPAAEMRVVGNGIDQAGVNDWDPASSPQMTYAGNGVWTITISLKANKEIKFLAGNAWGAFDYEDNGDGGSTVGTTVRKIKWDGGPNFSTPGIAGTYTITLDEYNQKVTIQ